MKKIIEKVLESYDEGRDYFNEIGSDYKIIAQKILKDKSVSDLFIEQNKQILLDYKEWYENKYEGECIVNLYYINQFIMSNFN